MRNPETIRAFQDDRGPRKKLLSLHRSPGDSKDKFSQSGGTEKKLRSKALK